MALLRVTYARASELRRDLETQLVHGGLLVRAGAAAALELRQPVTLEIVTPAGASVRGAGEVLHVQPGSGVAVSFPAEAVERLRALLPEEGPDAEAAAPARHELLTPSAATPTAPSAGSPRPLSQRLETLTQAEKIQLALHGSKDERAALLRDPRSRMVHAYVLKNPQLGADEVLAIAKNPQAAPELLQQIAERKEWFQRPAIAAALARNPKTPPAAGVRALEHVAVADLRHFAKGSGVPPHIVQAARKKVL